MQKCVHTDKIITLSVIDNLLKVGKGGLLVEEGGVEGGGAGGDVVPVVAAHVVGEALGWGVNHLLQACGKGVDVAAGEVALGLESYLEVGGDVAHHNRCPVALSLIHI